MRRGVLGGIHGGGLAAPWNLILQMWVSLALASKAGATGRRARAWLALVSALFVAGSVGESVSHEIVTRNLPPSDTLVAVANIAVPIALLVAVLASLVDGEGECA